MSTTNVDLNARPVNSPIRTLTAAGIAIVAAALTAIYGAYGDPHPNTDQEHGVPLVVGAGIVFAALIFGLLVPWAARTAARSAGWGLALSLVGLIAIPVAFWSGFNLIIAAAGALIGLRAGQAARQAGRSSRFATAAASIGVVAMVLSSALLVLGNTVLA